MSEFSNYYAYSKLAWRQLYPGSISLVPACFRIKALNDQISLADVHDVYVPLIHLLRLRLASFRDWSVTRARFLRRPVNPAPFIIGVSGSVAVGKSTVTRLLKILFDQFFRGIRVQIMNTDGFLYPNHILKQAGLIQRKGFPESYDLPKLINFLKQVKGGCHRVKFPVYSQRIYDVLAHRYNSVDIPDVLIIDGINVLQRSRQSLLSVSDFLDFSIYIDADAALIKKWFLDRFWRLVKSAHHNSASFYRRFLGDDPRYVMKLASSVWDRVNLPNLRKYIFPTRGRADLIIHKTHHHRIDRLWLRKY